MISRKPVKALLGAAHLEAAGIQISNIAEPTIVFKAPPQRPQSASPKI
jgi:hypothetical protein